MSVDSVYCNAAWAAALGGIAVPLLSDFHPKGAVADSLGLYLAPAGVDDRATVLIDADGIVRYAVSVGPGGKRDIAALATEAERMDAAYGKALPELRITSTLPGDVVLYVRDGCMFSRWVLYARANLHLDLPVKNVSTDAAARAELEAQGGKSQAPALRVADRVMYESGDILQFLVEHCGAF